METNKPSKTDNTKAALIGGLVGGMIGLLLAPKSGQEFRQDIVEQANKMGDKAIEVKNIAQNAYHDVEGKTKGTLHSGRDLLQKGKQTVSNLKTLVYEIQQGALTKTAPIHLSDQEVISDPTNEIPIIENEHED